MKRAVSALAATVAGVALLAGYKPTPAGTASQPSATPPAAVLVPPDANAPARTPAPTPAANAPSGPSRVVTGQTVDTMFGEVQVRVTVAGKRIMDVQPVQLPYDRARSAYISQVAGPMLRSEAIQAQSANIDVISGATYTSIAYGRSLQSALQQANN